MGGWNLRSAALGIGLVLTMAGAAHAQVTCSVVGNQIFCPTTMSAPGWAETMSAIANAPVVLAQTQEANARAQEARARAELLRQQTELLRQQGWQGNANAGGPRDDGRGARMAACSDANPTDDAAYQACFDRYR